MCCDISVVFSLPQLRPCTQFSMYYSKMKSASLLAFITPMWHHCTIFSRFFDKCLQLWTLKSHMSQIENSRRSVLIFPNKLFWSHCVSIMREWFCLVEWHLSWICFSHVQEKITKNTFCRSWFLQLVVWLWSTSNLCTTRNNFQGRFDLFGWHSHEILFWLTYMWKNLFGILHDLQH